MTKFYEHEKSESLEYRGPRPEMPEINSRLLAEMEHYLESRELDFGLAYSNGWYPTTRLDDAWRIVIPCSNSAGVTYFQARAMHAHPIRYQSPRASREDSIVLVWPKATDQIKNRAVIVEGPMDALAAADFGFVGIGLMGNSPPPVVIEYVTSIVKGSFEPVIVVPDLDHLEMGPLVLGSLAARGIKGKVAVPNKKDLCEMKRAKRELFLEVVS